MPELLAMAVGAVMAGGVLLLIAGLRPRPEHNESKLSTSAYGQLRRRTLGYFHGRAGRHRAIRLALGAAAGVFALAITGWPLMLLLGPLVALGLPYLLARPANRDIELLGALDRWIRLLAANLSTGQSIPDAIRATRRQTPRLIVEQVALVVARLDDRWPVRQALLAMADDLASPDSDAVLAALILAAERGGTGATATLGALADSIQDRLRAAREIESERAKPRIVVQQVTVFTGLILGAALLLARDFFAPYSTWYGQIILTALLAAYLAALLWLRRLTTPRPRDRILQ